MARSSFGTHIAYQRLRSLLSSTERFLLSIDNVASSIQSICASSVDPLERQSKRGEAVDFGHRVGGTLFNPASLTNGCMGKHCGVKPSWDYRRCTEAKESPGRAGALRTNKESSAH
jgi:hypothetical protein